MPVVGRNDGIYLVGRQKFFLEHHRQGVPGRDVANRQEPEKLFSVWPRPPLGELPVNMRGNPHKAPADHGGIESMPTSINISFRSLEDDRLDIVAKRVDVLSNSPLWDGALHDTLEGNFPSWMHIDQGTRGEPEVLLLPSFWPPPWRGLNIKPILVHECVQQIRRSDSDVLL